MITLAVLDIAGTTVVDDDAVGRHLRDALAAEGVDVSRADVNAVMGWPKPAAIRHLLSDAAAGANVSEVQVERIHAAFVERMVAHYSGEPGAQAIDGVERLLTRLGDASVQVILDTGFDRTIARTILEGLGWKRRKLVRGCVTSSDVSRGRPDPDMVWRAMAMTCISDPARVAKVGDTPSDLIEGTRAGCGRVVGVTWGSHTADELRPYAHTHLVDSVDALERVLLA